MLVEFTAPLARFTHGRGTYHLVTLPEETSDLINYLPLARHGFNSIKVTAEIGETTWKTSLFPSGESFILLVAKKLIAKETLWVGHPVHITLEV